MPSSFIDRLFLNVLVLCLLDLVIRPIGNSLIVCPIISRFRVAHGLKSSKRRKQVLVIKWLMFCEEAHDPFGQYPMTCQSNIWGKLKCQLLYFSHPVFLFADIGTIIATLAIIIREKSTPQTLPQYTKQLLMETTSL